MPSDIMHNIKGVIFDLDGVLVDTAAYHYKAWKSLAEEWKYSLTHSDNEQLKGVSRKDSVIKIAQWAGVHVSSKELEEVAQRKNEIYLALCQSLSYDDVLPGIKPFLQELKENQIQLALGSASKNARFVIQKLGLSTFFDVIVDGNDVFKSNRTQRCF